MQFLQTDTNVSYWCDKTIQTHKKATHGSLSIGPRLTNHVHAHKYMWHHSCHTTIAMSTNSAFLFVGKIDCEEVRKSRVCAKNNFKTFCVVHSAKKKKKKAHNSLQKGCAISFFFFFF